MGDLRVPHLATNQLDTLLPCHLDRGIQVSLLLVFLSISFEGSEEENESGHRYSSLIERAHR